MEPQELEAWADSVLDQYRSAPRTTTAPPPPTAPLAGPAPDQDLATWADQLLAQHRTAAPQDRAPLMRRMFGRA